MRCIEFIGKIQINNGTKRIVNEVSEIELCVDKELFSLPFHLPMLSKATGEKREEKRKRRNKRVESEGHVSKTSE